MDYKEFLKRFNDRSGFNFCDYSSNSISRRLQKICDETGLSFEEILDTIVSDKELVRRIVEDITVNTTELFRDPTVWISLAQNLYNTLPTYSTSTFWHIGCSSGQELYSNLILLNELGLSDHVRVIGTDINATILEVAKSGEYPYDFNKDVYINNFNAVMNGLGINASFDKYFDIDEQNDVMRVKEPLRSKAIFLLQDLVKDKAPFPYRVDVTFIRNVMIYFNDDLKNRIVLSIIDKLYDGGALILGKQEELPTETISYFENKGTFYKNFYKP